MAIEPILPSQPGTRWSDGWTRRLASTREARCCCWWNLAQASVEDWNAVIQTLMSRLRATIGEPRSSVSLRSTTRRAKLVTRQRIADCAIRLRYTHSPERISGVVMPLAAIPSTSTCLEPIIQSMWIRLRFPPLASSSAGASALPLTKHML